jgi:viologen exporter family transport system permease protein
VRAYLKTAALTAAAVGDSPLFLLDYGLRLLRVVVLLSLWRVVLAESTQPEVMPLATVLTYTLLTEVFNDQIAVQTTIVETFWEGTVVLRFLRPMGVVTQFAAEMVGRWTVNLGLFSIPLLLLAPVLGVDPRPASLPAGLLFIPSLALGIIVGLAIDFLFATVIVAFEQQPWLVHNARTAVAALLSGSLLPLAYYPWGLGELFSLLPFAAMAWAPLAVYTGTGDPVRLIGAQVFWVVVLWPLVARLWRASRERMVGFGG